MDDALPIPPRYRRSRNRPYLWGWLFLFLVSAAVTICFLWDRYSPNSSHIPPDFQGMDKPVFYKGELLKPSAQGTKEDLKIPLSLVREEIDSHIVYEEQSDSVIITSRDKVLRLKSSELTGWLNEKPFQLEFPVQKIGGEVYLPIAPLKSFYHVEWRESAQTGAVILLKEGDQIAWGRTETLDHHPKRTIALRSGPTIKAPILADLPQDLPVMIWGDKDGWYRVQTGEGIVGYVPKKWVRRDHTETVPVPEKKEPFSVWKPPTGRINLTWEQIYNTNPDPRTIGPMPGLNVISPAWFALKDAGGGISNRADAGYVDWAHKQNYQIWALFSNGFDPEVTTKALASYDTRMNMIKQLLAFAEMYRLQGINIDFENVYLKDRENLVQFVREMVPLFHEQGLAVSMDVTTKSTSEMWSKFYDRQALAEAMDYMIVMAYDEHWASSPSAGSVASLPWVENGIRRILEEDRVPSSKLVLGVPFYTRIWTEEEKDGKLSVTSQAVSMDKTRRLIAEKGLKPVYSGETGQNYVEFKEGDKTMKIWLEDETSMKARVELVKKYNLAGIASWRRGYEIPEIWETIRQTLGGP